MCDTHPAENLYEWQMVEQRGRLGKSQLDFPDASSLSTIGELTMSLSAGISTPLAAAVSNAEACLLWLAHDQPDLKEAREAATEMIKETRRAAAIIAHVRASFKKGNAKSEEIDPKEGLSDTVPALRREADQCSAPVRKEPAEL
jgi:C4-dicarboxylate-specific signal transduction histidine kinase